MLDIFEKMVETQARLNAMTIGNDWIKKHPNFCLAISQECAEGIDHLGYKWWAKQEPNYDAAMGEAVDVMHFALSEIIATRSLKETPYALDAALRTMYHAEVLVGRRKMLLEQMNAIELFRLISTLAGHDIVDARTIFALAERLGLPFTSFARLYFCKAVLNQFRQDHGYQQGHYKKVWGGIEDNVYLKDFSHSLDWTSADAPSRLYEHLQALYHVELNNA